MGITSTDIANATAGNAQRAVEDLAVMVDWLIKRVTELEAQLDIGPSDRPELPSERRQRLFREADAQEREQFARRMWDGIGRFNQL